MPFLVFVLASCIKDEDCGLTYYCSQDVCRCLAGYFGAACNLTESYCKNYICNKQGSCVFVNNEQLCNCTTDHYGPVCNYTQDECKLSCYNGGLCNSLGGCECPEGLNFDPNSRCYHCLASYALIDGVCHLATCVSRNQVCSNHGNCSDAGVCICMPDYYGYFCEMAYAECDRSSCSAAGVCRLQIDESCPLMAYYGFSCQCKLNFYGCNCEKCVEGFTMIEGVCVSVYCVYPGSSTVCTKQGECSNDSCICQSGKYGYFCEVGLEYCNAVYCNSNGVCQQQNEGRQTCNCSANFDPMELCSGCMAGHIEIGRACVPQQCTNDNITVCSNAGTCDTECICEDRFGSFCELTAEECGMVQCNGNGDCSAAGCVCYYNYEGTQCYNCRFSELVYIEGKCYHKNCVTDNIVCSYQGDCVEQECVCQTSRFGSQCYLSASECSKYYCNGKGACIYESGTITCSCFEGWTLASCLVCDTYNYYILIGEYCVKAACVDHGVICGGRGTCVNGICVCEHTFGRYCELTQQQCDAYTCNNVGECILLENKIKCKCGSKIRGFCCKFGYMGEGCLSLSGLLGFVLIPTIVVVAVVLFTLWYVGYRKIQLNQRRRNVEKHYVGGDVKITKYGRNFFMV